MPFETYRTIGSNKSLV